MTYFKVISLHLSETDQESYTKPHSRQPVAQQGIKLQTEQPYSPRSITNKLPK
jgi:hypothetical protein